jgi:hypothetical protein
MEQRVEWTGRNCGGILSLVRLINQYDRSLEYDLMTRTGRTLSEYINMGAAGLVALISFIQNLPPDSALNRAMNPKDEVGAWYSPIKTNAILADLFDAFVAANTKHGKKPKEYPRPQKHKTIGHGAVPVSEFWDWWNKEVT